MTEKVLTEEGQQCLQALMRVWFDFERSLSRVPLIQKLERDLFTVEDYRKLLLNIRQQVIEGSRWITRCASSFDREFSDVRSEVIAHARDEHRDYLLLEEDYVAAGGVLSDIQEADRNPGSEALHGFLMYRATQPNPIDLIGAMWIIEGLGQKMATGWSERIESMLKEESNPGSNRQRCTRFMRYHGENDSEHMDKLYSLIDRVCKTKSDRKAIVRTATVVARLYSMQLEEVDYE
ncbi:hypothetical protein [Endozoicomonas arenosclerae]|uniref:hypothetical protein n=1 Tax=Endozoicomonas arenosclerae TaxID=1633495 RepID=UPI000782F2BA|nr:hypothetical protein [Endozoicomonas arenosclerae]